MSLPEFVAPEEVGLCSNRLERIPEFFQTNFIDKGKLPCAAVLVARDDKPAYLSLSGKTSMEDDGVPIADDTIYRIYSMTKPVTSVAAMMLFEEGRLRLDDPVAKYIPAFAETKVWDGGTIDQPILRDPDRAMTVFDLMTHTSGLSYGFLFQHEVDAYYRALKLDQNTHDGDLESFSNALAKAPLLFSPGDRWNYSNSTDVLGRVVEVASGEPLDEHFKRRIFDPLGMNDTGFWAEGERAERLMACYARHPETGKISLADKAGPEARFARRPKILSGGGGLTSTIIDYFKFARMLARGGEVDGVRLLSPKTIDFMAVNALPDNKTLAQMGDTTFSEARMEGSGFGLGFGVTVDPVANRNPCSMGSFNWGGMASTFFWVDPAEDLFCVLMTQLMPSGAYPIRPLLQQLVYASITE